MSQRRLPLGNVVTVPTTRGRNRGAYRRGAAAERELLRSLQQDGLLAVRSAASAGPFDLYALTDRGGRALQVKSYATEPPSWLVRRWLAALPAVPLGWSRELWIKTARHGWRTFVAAGEEQSA